MKKILILIMLHTSAAYATHECKDYAFEKAAKYAELLICDSYIPNCGVEREEIKMISYLVLPMDPIVTLYSLTVPVYSSVREAPLNITINIDAGEEGYGSTYCYATDIEVLAISE